MDYENSPMARFAAVFGPPPLARHAQDGRPGWIRVEEFRRWLRQNTTTGPLESSFNAGWSQCLNWITEELWPHGDGPPSPGVTDVEAVIENAADRFGTSEYDFLKGWHAAAAEAGQQIA